MNLNHAARFVGLWSAIWKLSWIGTVNSACLCRSASHVRKREEQKPGGFENEIVLSDEFFREVTTHAIPTDLEAAKALSSSPAALDLFMWLSYRCFTAKGQERIPIFGDFGLSAQLGSADYARPRKFRERLDCWVDLVRGLWPGCPARISSDGGYILIQPAVALAAKGA
jgi:hypothetical protein